MKKALTAIALAAAAVGANAGIYLFDDEFSQSGSDCGNVVFGCAALRTTAIAGGVHFEFLGTMSGTEKITGLYGNIDPYAVPTVANTTGTGLPAADLPFLFTQNGFKADGDGWFDWFLGFNPSVPTFDGNMLLEWDFLGVTLAQIDSGLSEDGPVGKTGFHFAIHTQGLVNGGSGWFSGDPAGGRPTPFDEPPNGVPEPTTLMLAGMALFGLWAGGKRKDA
jgi:hypothetical protein